MTAVTEFVPDAPKSKEQKRDKSEINSKSKNESLSSSPSINDIQQASEDDIRQKYISMSAGQQFEQVLHKDRQQNLRLLHRFDRATLPTINSDTEGRNCKIESNFNKINQYESSITINDDHSKYSDGCFWVFKERMRFIVILLGFIAIVLNQMTRVIFNITIPLMTHPVNSTCHPPSPDACPIINISNSSLCGNNHLYDNNGNNIFDDNIQRFDWTSAQQDQLLGAFFYTYSGLQIPFGILAEKYGSKYLIGASVSISGLCNLLTPFLARQEAGLTFLWWSRLLVGASQAAILPSIYALIAQWITATESIVIASLLKMAFRLGALMGSIVPGLVIGWQPSYYITGGICVLWSLLWFFLVTSKPQDNSCVSMQELFRIARKKNDRKKILASVETNPIDKLQLRPKFESNHSDSSVSGSALSLNASLGQNSSTPNSNDNTNHNKSNNLRVWWIILSSRSVIGFILCKLTVNFTTDFLTGIMPTYIRDLYHGDKTKISIVNSMTASVQVIVSFPISWLIKYTNRSKPFGLKATGLRRVFSGVTCFGSALFLALLTIVRCDLIYAGLILQFLAITNMLSGGSEALIPYDLSDEFPATIAAIGNSFSSISGFVIPKLKTYIIGDKTDSVSAWNDYILTIALLQAIGGFIFIFNVKAKRLDFSAKKPITSENVEPGLPRPEDDLETKKSAFSNEDISQLKQTDATNNIKS